jgi:hypothetical protein
MMQCGGEDRTAMMSGDVDGGYNRSGISGRSHNFFLTCDFEHMMVGILIHVENSKHIIGVVWLHAAGNRISTIDWNKVCGVIDPIDMYYFEMRCVVGKVAESDD